MTYQVPEAPARIGDELQASLVLGQPPEQFGQLVLHRLHMLTFPVSSERVKLGADLVWRDDHWETRPADSRDRDIKRARNSDELIRNVYKVLLTRGLRGCIIYSTDLETRQMLAGLGIPSPPGAAVR
jgi:hypothetical protein